MRNQKQHVTANMYEIAAIEYLSGAKPDDIMVERNSKIGVAVYNDLSVLPSEKDLKPYMEYKDVYIQVKRKIFQIIDETIEKGESNETDRTDEVSLRKKADKD